MGFYKHYRGGPLINVFLRVYLDGFRLSSRFDFQPKKQSSFYIFGVIVDSRGFYLFFGVFIGMVFLTFFVNGEIICIQEYELNLAMVLGNYSFCFMSAKGVCPY